MRPQEWASRPASWYVRFACGCSGALLTELIQRWLHWQASGSFGQLGANDLAGALLLVLIAGCLAVFAPWHWVGMDTPRAAFAIGFAARFVAPLLAKGQFRPTP